MKKSVSLENVNMLLLNQKINEYISQNGLNSAEPHCRLVQLVLRHKVHHFPINIPFIAAVKKCDDEKQVVFNVKRAKCACIQDISIASETKVEDSFVIDNIMYEKIDVLNGQPRYQPIFGKKTKKTVK